MNLRRCALLAMLGVAACQTPPRDSFAIAQAAMRRDDLLNALLAYDAVPVLHPSYPEARAGAAAVELRMRRGHELLLEGLIRRGEWRDAEALHCLERARSIWPDLPGIDALITATRHRLDLFAAAAASFPPNEDAPTTTPVAVAVPDPVAPEPGLPAAAPAPRLLLSELADESITLGLVAVEARLGRGEFECAVVDLLELARRFPDDLRVQRRLARVLHQRALLRYGQGALTAALLDLERVLAIEPDNGEVVGLLHAVRAEATAATPP